MAAGLELRGLKNRQLKREANSEICQIPTKRRKICSHHPKVVVEKLDSGHSNMEIDGYPGTYLPQARYQHSSFSILPARLDGNTAVANCTSPSAFKEHSDHSTTSSICLKTERMEII